MFLGIVPAIALGDSTAPVDFNIAQGSGITVGAGEPFLWEPRFFYSVSDPSTVPPFSLKWTATLSGGVKLLHGFIPGRAGVLENCLSSCPIEFTGSSDAVYDYMLVASATGNYTLGVQIVSTSNPDPNMANNSASISVNVVPLQI